MLFSSITFLYYFLPIVFALYFLAPKKLKNLVLFISSLVFYAWGEPKYVFLMILSVAIGYIAGLLMDKLPKKPVLIVSIAACLFFLIYFKYTNFFITNINAALKTDFPLLKVLMPIGISFYTFQIISYIVDVYRKDVEKQRNFFHLAAYISMFPQLIAGPIVRYSDINDQLENRRHSVQDISYGIQRFILGLSKKVLVANQLYELCQIFRMSGEKSILFYWIYAIATMLNIYFDFSGYSDMAIGLGKILGFSFLENFNYPFMSKSVTEFWRRWHMSLGTWFRDYVYIPLGGNRVGAKRQIINILIVWFLTGFWHGAEWNFIIWGLIFAVLLIIEKLWLYKKLDSSKIISRLYMFIIISITFVIFNAAGTAEMVSYIKNMFLLGDSKAFLSKECVYYFKSFAPILAISVIGATSIPKNMYLRIKENPVIDKVSMIAEPLVLLLLLMLSTAYLVDGSFNPFLYFRF
ncbi:MAG: MBOAT family protein [Firmicutes bacterium]|nr:MBOAT family protein [Bacillota bacterium]